MTDIEFYSLIFTDTLIANIAFCFCDEVALHTVSIFENYNILLLMLVANVAALIAYAINYVFGYITFQIARPLQKEEGVENAKYLQQFSDHIAFKIILFLSALTIYGKFLIFFTGFVRLKFKNVMVVSLIAKLFYYSWFL